jgi:hypothetical protein
VARLKPHLRQQLLSANAIVILEVGAVVLRPYWDADHDALMTILADPEVMSLVLEERMFPGTKPNSFYAPN